MASAILDTSALTKFFAFSGLLSERRSLYLPANSRARCVPTSPVAPVINTVFMLIFLFSFPVFCVHCAFRRPSLDDLGRLRRRFPRLVLDRLRSEPGGM